MRTRLDACLRAVNEVLLGKEAQVRLALACLLARGHLLVEDMPGMGKTTLSHALAKVLGLEFQRIQFTSDLLPGDILGTSVFDKDSGQFVFHPGPIFAELILADEINRATPKSQSALLEAMEEGQVTIEGATRALPEPFFVIATQNPVSSGGTFALPESQLDRFLMRVSLGYPARAAEKALLLGESRRDLLARLAPLLERAIELVSPRLVLILGASAAKAMLGKDEGILALRGRWHEWRSHSGNLELPVMPTLHPAFLLRQPAAKKKVWSDLLTLTERLDRPDRPA